jgi:signal transduction histidine kinase/ActR/RegA family two-component response regulator
VDRARLYEAEKKARIRSEFLAKASAVLGESLDYQRTLQTVAGFAVPGFADWVAADLIRDDGTIERVAVAAADPAKVQLGRELFRRFPPKWDDPVGVPRVLRTGKSEFVDEILDSLLVKYIDDPELLQMVHELQLKSSIIVPMKARGRSIGAMIFLMGGSGRRYTPEDVALAEDLGIRAGVAVDNARLYRESLEASRLKDEFLSTLSHELRTPLTAILGWTRILNDRASTEQKRARAVEIIERNARAQAQLIEDMLDVSRIITGKMRLDVRLLTPLLSIEAAIDAVRPAAETKGVRIQTLLDPRAGPIMGDPDRLQQIVWNLLSNAIKFTARGGRVLVQLIRINSHIEVEVTDSGEGIAPEFLPYVFEKFRQGDPSTKRPYGGLGLGLAIVRHLVELHGGKVEARSEGLGKGATFRVVFPLSPVHFEPAEPAREHPTPGGTPLQLASSSQLNGLRILVVDDEEDARELLKEVLERHQAEVGCVGNAPDALSALKEGKWDVLVSDLGMPGEDGYALITKVRNRSLAEGGQLPAVAITAYARLEDRTSALRAGFDAHVAKPVDPVELVEVVAAVVRRGRVAAPSA